MKRFFTFLRYALSIYWLALATSSYGQQRGVYNYTDDKVMQPLRNGLLILPDPKDKYSPDQLIKYTNFTVNRGDVVPDLGMSGSAFWVKFQIQNLSETDHLLLKLAQPNIEEVTFYTLKADVIYSESTGTKYPYKQRKYDNQHFLFDLKLPKGETGIYLLRLKTTGQLQVPLWVGSSQIVHQSLSNENLYIGLYLGIVLAMFLYNVFLFLTIRSHSYFFYVLNIFVVGLTQATFQGYTYRFLWPNMPWIATHSLILLTALSAISSLYFIRVFARLSKFNRHLDTGIKILLLAFIPMIFLAITGFEKISYEITRIIALIAASYSLLVIYIVYRKGSRTAGFLLLAWCIFLAGTCIFALKDIGILPYNDFTNNTMLIGSATEMILLSFALADRINKLKKEKERSQKKMVEALQANERMIQEENLRLELRVRERTRELEASTEQLQATLTHLKNTQAQLLQAEKMASLGQLTAGIAHEINNPINFVSASIKPLRRDVNYLWLLVDKYEKTLKGMECEFQKMEIETLKKRLDVDYLKEEIDLLLEGVEDGASRTASIVLGLRTFARLDDEEARPVNVHEGLDSTLLLLNHSLKESIQIKRDYTLSSEVKCYPGKLNQVFMNLLTNAVQAIKARNNPTNMGILMIRTWEAGGKAVISIRDNGIGMPESMQKKIFDPFFTTKEIGEGTGLGLSIVFGIIEAHKGTIDVKSNQGAGTEFIISIPLVRASQLAIVA